MRQSLHRLTLVGLSIASPSAALTTSKRGFTLIELLVVVAIIAVLLALLMPAMDRAIYQADLAVCATRLSAATTGAQIYAASHKRTYPAHPDVTFVPYLLENKQTGPSASTVVTDFRPTLRTFMSLNANLNDPLTKTVNLETDAPRWVYTTYLIWFGYGYTGEVGMKKMGSRWTYAPPGTTETESFSLMISDHAANQRGIIAAASHPDHAGLMWQEVFDNDDYSDQGKATFSRWVTGAEGDNPALKVDTNWSHEDGSVGRLNDMTLDLRDERTTTVPVYRDKTEADTGKIIVPQE